MRNPEIVTISFSVMTDLEHRDQVVAMMRRLYEEDRGDFDLDRTRFASGVEHLIAHPSVGRIVLFLEDGELRGYALLVPYWSNEFGGTLLFVDELFVLPEFRSQGIGRSFFSYLDRDRPFDPVAFGLGVNPRNARARRLYESVGFVALGITTFLRPISEARPWIPPIRSLILCPDHADCESTIRQA
jgi:GNAT superfamily N-acetyltransferase